MREIRLAIAGVGNCASSLVQGLAWYGQLEDQRQTNAVGLRHPELGGYRVTDIAIAATFDIDARKVGKPLEEAIFAAPNNSRQIVDRLGRGDVIVQMGPVLDGVAEHMSAYPENRRFVVAEQKPCDVVRVLRDSRADVLVNYMPVGSQRATEAYARACLEAGIGFVNCVPVFIASDPGWATQFKRAGIPCVGDDVKSQFGATIVHRTLARLMEERGVRIDSTYQLNTGGNTDFLNMLSRDRLEQKKISKTEAVQSQLDVPLAAEQIHIGPSDYVPFLRDNKVCYLRLEGTGFAGVPLNLELRLSVEDSPNSAGVVVDAIRCCKLALDAKTGGALIEPSAWTMKHPPKQMTDTEALAAMHEFVARVSG